LPLSLSLTRTAFSFPSSAFMATHKSNIALWSAFVVVVFFCYHLFSDGDFSFLMVPNGCSSPRRQLPVELTYTPLCRPWAPSCAPSASPS